MASSAHRTALQGFSGFRLAHVRVPHLKSGFCWTWNYERSAAWIVRFSSAKNKFHFLFRDKRIRLLVGGSETHSDWESVFLCIRTIHHDLSRVCTIFAQPAAFLTSTSFGLFFTRRVHQKFKHSHVHRRFCVALFAESDVWQWFIDSQPTCKRKYVRVRQRMTYAHAYLAECWFACSGLGKYNVNDLLTRLICVSCSRSPFVFPFILPSINSGTNFMQRRSLILLNPQCPCPWPLLKNCFLCFQQKEN